MKWFLFFILIFYSSRSYSQNLIPNGGFENYDACPIHNYGETNNLKNWYDYTVSPDYYNCNIGVPNNIFGYQYPSSGTAYIGFGQGERVAVKLIQALEAGKIYEMKMKVVSGNYANHSSDFNFFLSEDSLCLYSKNFDIHTIHTSAPLSDTANWTEISTTFVANGCEKYLALDIPYPTYIYYYFDDVSLECADTSGCFPPQCPSYSAYVPNIFSPNNDGINEEFKVVVANTELSDFNCTIYDRWGKTVVELLYPNTSWDGNNQNGKEASEGVYYYMMNYTITECGEWYSQQGYVHLVR